MKAVQIEGIDNDGKPRQEFSDNISAMNDDDFAKESEKRIWLSAFASNKPRSDYHWQADACYSEAHRRGKGYLYTMAWERASGRK